LKPSDKPVSGTILGDRRKSVDSKTPLPAPEPAKLTPEERKRKTDGMLREYLASNDLGEASEGVKEIGGDYEEVLETLYSEVLERKEKDRQMVAALVVKVCEAKIVKGPQAADALCRMFGVVEDLEMDVPKVGSYIASFSADLIVPKYIELAQLLPGLEPLAEFGKAAKLVASTLVFVAKNSSEAAARAQWEASGLTLKQFMHPEDRNDEAALEFATSNKLGWLYPLMDCQTYLTKALTVTGEDADVVLGWLKANVSEELLMSDQAARIIMRLLLNHFSENTPERKEEFKKYAKILEELYGAESDEMTKLQLQMIYEVQLFCHERNFEAGLVKRLFSLSYEFDTIGEDAFDMWREATDETTPGKRRALLDANPFLQWLATAEEEEEEDDEDE